MAVAWNLENAAHLLRRAAFGGTVEEVQAFYDAHGSVAEAVADLLSFSVSTKKPPKGGNDFWRARLKQRQWWLKTILKSTSHRDAVREKMVLFWHGHLCSGFSKQPDPSYMGIQNGLFRRFAGGNFKDLVREFHRDPANLHYLDGIQNYASNDGHLVSANENFARELMELFTLGISQLAADGTNDPDLPNYSEDDVHQMARALTGWVTIEKGIGVWQSWAWDGGQYDDGGGSDHPGDPVTIFGVTNNNFRIGSADNLPDPADDVLELVFGRLDAAGNHQAAMFLCRKLWTAFAYPAPAPGLKDLLQGFAATLVANNWEVLPVLSAMFQHDEFYGERARTRTVKSPIDYVIGTLRMLGVRSIGKTLGDGGELSDMLGAMGQALFEPPNVAGWPGGRRWITTGTLVNRLDFARRVAELDWGLSALDLGQFGFPWGPAADPQVVLDRILARLGLDGAMGGIALTAAQQAALLDFLTEGSTRATLDLSDAWTSDTTQLVRGTIALALQSAEAQIF